MKISVIIPVFNSELTLKRCVDSVLNQSHRDVEVICVDDGSEDSSPSLCAEIAASDDRVRFVEKPSTGVSGTRNRGLEEAVGDYIAFADADDYVEADCYEKMLEVAEREGADLVFCGFNVVDGEIHAANERLSAVALKNPTCFFYGERPVMGAVWRLLIKRELALKCRFKEDVGYKEDLLYVLEILSKCEKAAALELPLYNYRLPDDQRKYFTPSAVDGIAKFTASAVILAGDDHELASYIKFASLIDYFRIYIYGKEPRKIKKLLKNVDLKSLNTAENYRAYLSHAEPRSKRLAALVRLRLFRLTRLAYRVYRRFS